MSSNKLFNMKDSSSTLYYGVYTPNENKDPDGDYNVFDDKQEALKVAKKNKKSRFKAFQFYHEAVEFALNGSEFPNNNTTINGSSVQTIQAVGEKASPFKGPKPQELVELRKAIENGNIKFVRDIIWQNPRYLVSSGDTPSILQEGPRYNALHVAAKSKNAEITELILSTISDTEFIKLLYGDDNQQNAEDRTAILLDLYLNTPNKGLNETPLHFASKHGGAEVVEILVSFPQCDKTLRNKFNKLAEQIICERAEGSNIAEAKRKIEILLKDSFYVPVLRAEDNSMAPIIGEPFSPSSPPMLNANPLTPRLEIHAYAGPMNRKNAEEFRRVWKTPPRSLNFNSPVKKPNDLYGVSSLRFKDPRKGLERIGKTLANEYAVSWKEYWPFLGDFVDFATEEGMDSLERYLAERYASLGDSWLEESKQGSPESGACDEPSTVSSLCAAFSSCRLNDSFEPQATGKAVSYSDSVTYLDQACQVFATRISNDVRLTPTDDDNVFHKLETEVKQFEQLITSYMEGAQFNLVHFQKAHSLLGLRIAQKLGASGGSKEDELACLCNRLENILDQVAKSVDCFSSDDEVSEQCKPTTYKKQLICLLHHMIKILSQKCAEVLDEAEPCSCIYNPKRPCKRNSLSRSSSFKNSSKVFIGNGIENVPRKLYFDDDGDPPNVPNGYNLSNGHNDVEISSDEDDDNDDGDEDKFYTPCSSPTQSDDEFHDTELPKHDIFLEGDAPTKLDCEVFNALCYSKVQLDSKKYPNVYKWHHTVSLYSSGKRESWPASLEVKSRIFPNVSLNCSFELNSPRRTSTPTPSRFRVTGANSPKAVIKSLSMHL